LAAVFRCQLHGRTDDRFTRGIHWAHSTSRAPKVQAAKLSS
jgi:hypothetical protein